MIGSAWVILLGDWLGKAGPGGAVVGFLAGGLVVILVGACYAELAGYLPEAGSEFVYARRVYGRGLAFAVGWFLVLYLLSVTVFEAIAFAWIIETVFPGSAMLLVGIGAAVVITVLNLLGAQLAVVSHTLLTYSFFAAVACILIALLVNGDVHNGTPLFATTNGRPWWVGSGAIFAFCAYGLNGFQSIPHAIEERSGSISLRAIGFIIVGSIAAAAAFYCLVVIAASVIVPWRDLVTAPLPLVAAVRQLPHGELFAVALLVATAASLLKAWNGVFMMAVRLLVAMARAGCVPSAFARLHPRFESPAPAVLAVAACNIAGIFLGKGAIEPITDMSAMVLTLTYALCCWTVLQLRRRGLAGYFHVAPRALVWTGLAGSALMAACAFVTPFWQQDRLPLEWRLLGVWGLLGVAVWRYAVRRAAVKPDAVSQPTGPDSPSIRGPL